MIAPALVFPDYGFELPRGWIAPDRRVQRQGRLRPTTAADEWWWRSLGVPEELGIFHLWERVTDWDLRAQQWGDLFLEDARYLQNRYCQINALPAVPLGESRATPWIYWIRR